MFNRLKLQRDLNQLYKKREKLMEQINFNMECNLNLPKYFPVSTEVSSVEWELYDVNNRILEISKLLNM